MYIYTLEFDWKIEIKNFANCENFVKTISFYSFIGATINCSKEFSALIFDSSIFDFDYVLYIISLPNYLNKCLNFAFVLKNSVFFAFFTKFSHYFFHEILALFEAKFRERRENFSFSPETLVMKKIISFDYTFYW